MNEDSLRLDIVSCSELTSRAQRLRDGDNPFSDRNIEFREVGITLRLPDGFDMASRFRGFVISNLGATVRILDGPLQTSPVNPYRVEEKLRSMGYIDISHRIVNAEPRPGILVSYREIEQEFYGQDTIYTQFQGYFFSTSDRSFAVTAHYPAECTEALSPIVERMLLSFQPIQPDDE